MEEPESVSAVIDRLVTDFKALLADGERLLEAAADRSEDLPDMLRSAVAGSLEDGKERLTQAEALVLQKTRATARSVQHYLRANPWRSALLVGGFAVLVGYLAGRSKSQEK